MSKLIYKYYTTEGLEKSKNVSNSSRLILSEADKYGVSWKIISGTEVVSLNYKGKEQSFFHQNPSGTTALGLFVCNNKKMTNNLLQQADISVPAGYRIRKDHDQKYQMDVFEKLNKPLVVKPSDGTWGENISINVNTPKEYLEAVDLAMEYSAKKSSETLVEEMFVGDEYRVLTTRDKVIGVVKRIPANVIGNGIDSVKKLIETKNKEKIRGVKGEKSHVNIIIDKKLIKYLFEQGMNLDTKLKDGQKVFLRKVSNVSQGGEAIDFTDKVHSSVKEIAIKAINAIPGMVFVGIDFMSSDITKHQTKDTYVVIEINDSPGFDIHDYPYQGENRHAAREFLFIMFPELRELKIKK